MEKAGWLGWPFSVASRGDWAIGIRKDQPYTIDNYTINILCLNIVYPYVRVYSKSIHIYTHVIYDIYVYILFLYTWVSSINMIIIYILFFKYMQGGCLARSWSRGWLSKQLLRVPPGARQVSGISPDLQIEVEGFVRFVDLTWSFWALKMWKDGSMSQFCTSCLWIAHILPTLYTPTCFNPAEYVYRSKQFRSYTYISSYMFLCIYHISIMIQF